MDSSRGKCKEASGSSFRVAVFFCGPGYPLGRLHSSHWRLAIFHPWGRLATCGPIVNRPSGDWPFRGHVGRTPSSAGDPLVARLRRSHVLGSKSADFDVLWPAKEPRNNNFTFCCRRIVRRRGADTPCLLDRDSSRSSSESAQAANLFLRQLKVSDISLSGCRVGTSADRFYAPYGACLPKSWAAARMSAPHECVRHGPQASFRAGVQAEQKGV
jgi:hypothetical protein